MTTETTNLTVVYQADWQWGEFVIDRREIVLAKDFSAAVGEDARDEVLTAAGIDPTDEGAWIGLVARVAKHHTAIKPGDYVASSSYGSDWIFIRSS